MLPGTIKNNSNKEQDNNARSPVLENQIQQMLNKLMIDEDDTCINFSEEEQNLTDENEDEIKYFQLCSDNNSESTSPSFSFQRGNTKYPTISFSNYVQGFNQNVLFPLVSCQMLQNNIMRQRNNIKHNSNSRFVRTNTRKQTYDLKKDKNQYFYNNNISYQKFERRQSINQSQAVSLQLEILLYELGNSLVKSDKIDFFIYSKIKGNFINIIKTQKGSKIFQDYLGGTPIEIIHQIFLEIQPELVNIISDSYANYFIKRFYSFLSQKDKIDFLLSIQPEINRLSLDSIGTYSIQSIVEQVSSINEQSIIINSIQNSLEEFCYDTYGTHVIEKIISHFVQNLISFIYEYTINNLLPLAHNINGICIVKRILIVCNNPTIHNKLKQFAYDNALSLIEHPFGNYVIQVIVENWNEEEVEEILSKFKNKYAELSNKKYSSNVVERCLEKSEKILSQYIEEICDNGKIAEIMRNSFGNYVIQKALKISAGRNKEILADNVNKNIYKLNDKKLISKWKNIVSFHL